MRPIRSDKYMKNSVRKFRVMLTAFCVLQLGFALTFFLMADKPAIKMASIGYGTINILFIFVILSLIVIENKRRLISTSKVIGQEAAEAFKFSGVGLVLLDNKFQTI